MLFCRLPGRPAGISRRDAEGAEMHTSGRMEVRESSDGRFAVGRLHKWPEGEEAWAAIAHTPPTGEGPFADQHEENAQRLAACWNFLEGVRTKDIEGGGGEVGRLLEEERMLKWFAFDHLPPHLKDVSGPFYNLAVSVVRQIQPGPERTVALRKLLEAKDAAVRAVVHPGG